MAGDPFSIASLSVARVVVAVALLPISGARAAPLAADALPPSLLAECDAKAAPFGAYDRAIANSVAALDRIGAIRAEEFEEVRIGFCGLRAAGGPVAVASCGEDIILLDEKYAAEKEALVLNATLAHEMRHNFQHRARRAREGAGYCESARYREDKPQLEDEADAFGDAVGALFFLGRPVEIVNRCADPVAVYLEADDPAAARARGFEIVAAGGAALSAERALSSRFFFYAQTQPAAGARRRVFENPTSPVQRFIDGKQYRLRETRLAAAGREAGPFRLVLSCAAADAKKAR